ncbi:MAG TPA: energy transducer TonB [Steroidobacteraceae bacterium]|jgi:TonB family protein|nr:energy transducer TonB [Steroidobacteraceae bacterium]
MKHLTLAALASLLVLCIPAMAARKNAQLQQLDEQYRQIFDLRNTLLRSNDLQDLRGRHPVDDVESWVVSKSTAQQVSALRKQAKSRDPAVSEPALAALKPLLDENLWRAQLLSDYWFRSAPAPFWRRNWQAFADKNQVLPEALDPRIVEIEARLIAQLDSGDFHQAVAHTVPELNTAFRSMLADIRGSLAKQKNAAFLTFVPHKRPCMTAAERAQAPSDFYPAGARRRGEEGTVILRTQVGPTGCANATAIVVSTGSAELDQAGLLTAEYTRFRAGSDHGKPISSEITYAVKFVIKE